MVVEEEVAGFSFGKMKMDALKSEHARGQAAKVLYDLEMSLWHRGLSELLYDEQRECFRFEDGQFAFSRRQIDWKLLKERGYVS